MARVNSAESYEFLKNLPSKNPRNFVGVDKDRNQGFQRSTFVRIIDVEENNEERTIKNDRTSLLLRSLKKNWNFLNAQPVSQTNSKPSSSTQPSSSLEDRPSTSNRRTAEAIDEEDSMPATKHRRQS
ncbi:hypothetical protein M3Y97_00411800 [Aphelenchoides bicaudatus]|nr:hypothetical protein M3Y97_00411800 [Aphelenchoides bicaudatus]